MPFAQAKIGEGKLYIYWDSGYNNLVNQDEHGFYEVLPGATIYIQIAGISEFSTGDGIAVKIGFEDHTKTFYPVTVKTLTSGNGTGQDGVGDAADPIEWTVGYFDDGYHDVPVCSTMTVHYKYKSPDYLATVYDARRGMSVVAHLHAVPENPLGTLGAISALFIGLWLFLLGRGRAFNLPFMRA